ncbi:aldehyde dehydrogenase [Colletotrichum tofieldiae]|nr:aldehyde dehydrogenase [Colletotrichum tofieldiae]
MGEIATETAKFITEHGFVQIIDGKLSATERTRHGVNPANLTPKEEVPVASRGDVDRAVAAAHAAFKTWSKVPYDQRRKAVLAYADAIDGLRGQFRDLLISEQGKPIHPSRCGRAIIPWNFPLLLATGKIAPALLTGNVIIVKPSPFTPYCGLKLVELAQQFFPPGVVQSLSGDDDLGPWLTSHPGIDKISFTGSTTTGKLVMQSASKTLKRVTLELYVLVPCFIPVPTAHVDSKKRVEMTRQLSFPMSISTKLLRSKIDDIYADQAQVAFFAFLNSGQICLNLKRIYVHETIFERFKKSLVKHVKGYNLGDGSQQGVTHGPLQNSMQYERVKTFFSDIKTQGWEVAVGGEINTSQGYFITPTIIDRPPEKSRIVVEEPFGPIVPLLSWREEDEVIERANDTAMGLGASVWTNDLEKAARVAKQIQAGNVWINTHFDLSPLAPFAGHKESGIGAEWGTNGLKGFCNVQTLFLNKHVVS